MAFWYLNNGEIYQYHFQTWTTEKAPLTTTEPVSNAKISATGQWLAFLDAEGLVVTPLLKDEPVLLEARNNDSELGLSPDFVFSPDEQYLAYAATVGLHIADLSKKTSSLIWENDLERLSLDQIIEIYIPLSWSADQNWLTVWVSGWESGWLGLASLSNLQIFPLLGCSGGEWSPVDPTLAMIVRYDGYLLCGGEQDGIYIVSMAADGIDEKRIYHDPEPSSLNESVGANYLSWSPDNTQLLFVQENESRHPARLMLVSPDGTEAKQLVEVPNGKILSPLWEHNSERVYYVEQVEDVSSVYEVHLATLNKRLIYSATSSDQLLSLSPDNQWLVLAPRNPFENTNLLLLNINGETTIPLRTNTPNAAIGWQHLEEK